MDASGLDRRSVLAAGDPAYRAQLTLMKDKLRTWIASAKQAGRLAVRGGTCVDVTSRSKVPPPGVANDELRRAVFRYRRDISVAASSCTPGSRTIAPGSCVVLNVAVAEAVVMSMRSSRAGAPGT